MKNFSKIAKTDEFLEVYKMGKKWYCEGFIIFYQKNEKKKMAVVASKKIGKAVIRNRAKRLLRALFLAVEHQLEDGKYILIAKNEIIAISFSKMEKSLKWGFKKIGCLKEFV